MCYLVAALVVILFAFVPILGLFTWMVPIFILNRIIPLQFYAFILGVPLIVWLTMASTLIMSFTFSIAHWIEKHHSINHISFCTFIATETKKSLSSSNLFFTLCHLLGIVVFAAFCSFVFCVSPSLYLCSLFWFVYEVNKNDIAVDDDILNTRQSLYKCYFGVFNEIKSSFNSHFSYKTHRKLSKKIEYFKQFAFHIFCILLTNKHISSVSFEQNCNASILSSSRRTHTVASQDKGKE